MSFEIVRGDLGPAMPLTIQANGVAVDATAATSVELHWEKPDGTVVLVALTPVDAFVGEFQYIWQAGDTDLVGVHLGHVVVTTAGVPKTYPSDGSRLIWFINPQIGDTDY